MRAAPDEVVQSMQAFAARHGNDRLAHQLKTGELKLIFVDGRKGIELRCVSAELAKDIELIDERAPDSLGEFWGTWKGEDWSPSLEAACRIGARNRADRAVINDQATELFLYGRDILGGSVLQRDDALRRGMIAWVTDRHNNILGLAEVIDSWSSRGAVMKPSIDLGWYLREGG